jgi:2,3-bisphosphoglycerate-independent phosphoglycerate mutase
VEDLCVKHLVLLGDGMADFPLDELDGRTPLQAARTPAMDEAASLGLTGLFCPIPEGLPPGSDIGNLSLFGYDPHSTFTGRAPLEAARQGISLGPNDVAFRCNLVTLEDGAMASFTAGHIPTEDAAELIQALNAAFVDEPIQYYPGVSYRHLAIVSDAGAPVDALVATACTPPHDLSDKPYGPGLPKGPAEGLLRSYMDRSVEILADHAANARRRDGGHPAATSIWLWGQGQTPSLDSYADRFGVTGTVVSAVDLVKGIGVCAGLDFVDVPGATGYLDTNYEGKVAAALEALERQDFVYLHIEATDETSHEGRADLKIQALEDFDTRVVRPCLDWAQRQGDCRVLIAPDHVTSIASKTHAGGPVPFTLSGPGVSPNGARGYSEAEAEATGVLLRSGYALVPAMLSAETITPESLHTDAN